MEVMDFLKTTVKVKLFTSQQITHTFSFFPRHFGHFAVFLVGPNLFFRLQSSCKEIQKFPGADIKEANLIQDPDTG